MLVFGAAGVNNTKVNRQWVLLQIHATSVETFTLTDHKVYSLSHLKLAPPKGGGALGI